jgi:hypothetical protein
LVVIGNGSVVVGSVTAGRVVVGGSPVGPTDVDPVPPPDVPESVAVTSPPPQPLFHATNASTTSFHDKVRFIPTHLPNRHPH